MSDGKYFASGKKGEIFELKQALNSTKKSEKRDAVKKVIASMTVGKDVRCVSCSMASAHVLTFPVIAPSSRT